MSHASLKTDCFYFYCFYRIKSYFDLFPFHINFLFTHTTCLLLLLTLEIYTSTFKFPHSKLLTMFSFCFQLSNFHSSLGMEVTSYRVFTLDTRSTFGSRLSYLRVYCPRTLTRTLQRLRFNLLGISPV